MVKVAYELQSFAGFISHGEEPTEVECREKESIKVFHNTTPDL